MKDHADKIGIEVINIFLVNKVIASVIKCASRCNHYSVQCTLTNNIMTEEHCSRCNEVELQEHTVKCNHTKGMRKEFSTNLLKEIVKNRR